MGMLLRRDRSAHEALPHLVLAPVTASGPPGVPKAEHEQALEKVEQGFREQLAEIETKYQEILDEQTASVRESCEADAERRLAEAAREHKSAIAVLAQRHEAQLDALRLAHEEAIASLGEPRTARDEPSPRAAPPHTPASDTRRGPPARGR